METGHALALSFIIGGVFLISILDFSSNVSQTATMNQMDLTAQTKLHGMVDIIKNRLNKAGYLIDTANGNEEIESYNRNTSITFNADIDTSEDVDRGSITIEQVDSSLNVIVRDNTGSIDPEESSTIGGLDTLNIICFRENGDTINPPASSLQLDSIAFFEVTVVSELDYSYKPNNKKRYRPKAHWKSFIYPRNIDNVE